MAKARIRKLKQDRFWRWLTVEVYEKPAAADYYRRHPIKRRKMRLRYRRKFWREFNAACDRGMVRLGAMLAKGREKEKAVPHD